MAFGQSGFIRVNLWPKYAAYTTSLRLARQDRRLVKRRRKEFIATAPGAIFPTTLLRV